MMLIKKNKTKHFFKILLAEYSLVDWEYLGQRQGADQTRSINSELKIYFL